MKLNNAGCYVICYDLYYSLVSFLVTDLFCYQYKRQYSKSWTQNNDRQSCSFMNYQLSQNYTLHRNADLLNKNATE
jgi:hypothetical protein